MLLFFSFLSFKPLVTLLFIQLFCNIMYVSSKIDGADLMKTEQFFDFHFIRNCLKAFKIINWKLFEQVLWMTLICVMKRNLWLLMTPHCILLKRFQCLNCGDPCNMCAYVKCEKTGCLLSLSQKTNRKENVKMLLQNDYINNGVTNGIK